jgi:hypothetical protein
MYSTSSEVDGRESAPKMGFRNGTGETEDQERRNQAAATVSGMLKPPNRLDASVTEDISEVKGLFTRSFKQDQWDWFTVWTQLGRPGRKYCISILQTLGNLRQAITEQDLDRMAALRKQLKQAGVAVMLHRFLNPRTSEDLRGDGIGYIYIVSTRSNPKMLKIGYTERTVEQRVKEINSATGIMEPYGVRAVWTVRQAPQVERAVHDALAEYRVQLDREFFELNYATAFKVVGDIVQGSRREL